MPTMNNEHEWTRSEVTIAFNVFSSALVRHLAYNSATKQQRAI